ncbi:MAG: hypothetical protein HQK51_13410 [Oligoflexia bacterium]|nr:hypothetical protein [Oligoflexia bacterium]
MLTIKSRSIEKRRGVPNNSKRQVPLALQNTFTYRGDLLPEDISAHLSNINLELLKKGWISAISEIRGNTKLDFDEVYKNLIHSLEIKLKKQ